MRPLLFLFAFCLLLVSCSSGGGNINNSNQLTTANSTLNANGTVTTTQEVNATDAAGVTVMHIPNGTTITGSSAFTSLPVNVSVSTPTSGVFGMPQPITPGYTISSTAGAVDIAIGDMNSVSFSLSGTPNPVTISIPIANSGNLQTLSINMNKHDGNGWLFLGIGSTMGSAVEINVSNLCWFGIDNIYSSSSSGSSGGSSVMGQGF